MASVKMPNYGLLNGLAAGLNAGLDGFMAAKKMQRDDKTTKMLMLKSGLIETDDGSIDYSPEEKLKRQTAAEATRAKMANDKLGTEISARKSGFLVTPQGLQKDPEFVDYRKAMIDLKAKVMEGEIDKAEYDRQERILKLHAQMASQGYEPEMIPDMVNNTIDGGLGAPAPTTYKPSGKWLKSPDKALKDSLANLKEQASKDKLMAETEGVQFDVADKKPGSGARFQGLLDNRYGKGKINASQLSAQDVTKMFPGLEGTYRESIKPQKPLSANQKLDYADKEDIKHASKDYNEFVNAGGAQKMQNSLRQLDAAVTRLRKNPEILSGFTRKIPGSFGGLLQRNFNPELADLKQNIEKIIQQDLRPTLGAQFTEKEGEGLMQRSFDPALTPEQNLRKLEDEIKNLKSIASTRLAAMQHYEKNRNMRGFKGSENYDFSSGGGSDVEAKRKRLMELRAKKAAAGKK